MEEKITVETLVEAPLERAWECYTEPEHIMQWNHASSDWHCPSAVNDLRPGGTFEYRMESRDGSQGFDFGGTYDEVVPQKLIGYTMGDGRTARTEFAQEGQATRVTVAFDPETINSPEMQRDGWQAILDNFKKCAESH